MKRIVMVDVIIMLYYCLLRVGKEQIARHKGKVRIWKVKLVIRD